MLKIIKLRNQRKQKQNALTALRELKNKFEQRKAELEAASNDAQTDEDIEEINAQIADTKIATMEVSNIPDTPLPMLASKSVGAVAPVANIITAPLTIPINNTTNTLIPIIPPINTKT